ncbi:hypothetical protein [Methanobacterium formicicum]|nr:hypothetical protein [Methanobacterium formicicum]
MKEEFIDNIIPWAVISIGDIQIIEQSNVIHRGSNVVPYDTD